VEADVATGRILAVRLKSDIQVGPTETIANVHIDASTIR
jgi:hypothetical protein